MEMYENKDFLRLYENVRVGDKNAVIVTGIIKEREEWKMLSVIVIQNGKSEQLADYGQWK